MLSSPPKSEARLGLKFEVAAGLPQVSGLGVRRSSQRSARRRSNFRCAAIRSFTCR